MARLPGSPYGHADDDSWSENWDQFSSDFRQHAGEDQPAPAPAPPPKPQRDGAAEAREEFQQIGQQFGQVIGSALQPQSAPQSDQLAELRALGEPRQGRDLLGELDALGDDTSDEYDTFMKRYREERGDDPNAFRQRLRTARERDGFQAPQQPEPQVGTSQLSRQLEEEGFFARQAAEHAAERERETQRAVEESQGFSLDSISRSVRDFFGPRERREGDWMGEGREGWLRRFEAADAGLPETLRRQMSPERQRLDAQAELETRQRTAPGQRELADIYARSGDAFRQPHMQALYPPGEGASVATRYGTASLPEMAHTVVGRLVAADATKQEQALARAQAMMRGEASLPQMGYMRAQIESGARSIADIFTRMPIETAGVIAGYGMGLAETGNLEFRDNKLYAFGQEVERAVKQAFPNDPARQFEFAQTLAQGLGSTMAFATQAGVAHLLGAGPRGQLALIALSGMAAQVPDEFARVTEALNKGDATERDRVITVLANSVLGATEALPFAGTLNAGARGWRAQAARGLGQMVEETIQEAPIQQTGQNLTRMLTYDPKQDPYEGVLESGLVAAISGLGFGTAMSGGAPAERPIQEARARTAPAQQAPAPEQAPSAAAPAPFAQGAQIGVGDLTQARTHSGAWVPARVADIHTENGERWFVLEDMTQGSKARFWVRENSGGIAAPAAREQPSATQPTPAPAAGESRPVTDPQAQQVDAFLRNMLPPGVDLEVVQNRLNVGGIPADEVVRQVPRGYREARARTGGTRTEPAQQPTPAPVPAAPQADAAGYPIHPTLRQWSVPTTPPEAPQAQTQAPAEPAAAPEPQSPQSLGQRLEAVGNVMGASVTIGRRRRRKRK